MVAPLRSSRGGRPQAYADRAAARVQLAVWLTPEAHAALVRLAKGWGLRWPKQAIERLIVEAARREDRRERRAPR
jgi:hypothetical protein